MALEPGWARRKRSERRRGGADGFGLGELVTFYLQQTSAVNQLWAMFAATTFAAGAFALTVAGGRSSWLLLAGAAGFTFFAVGHFNMVISAVTRQEKARRDIARLVRLGKLRSRSLIHRHLADQKISIKQARNVHLAIDLCVYIAFLLAALCGDGCDAPDRKGNGATIARLLLAAVPNTEPGRPRIEQASFCRKKH